MADRTVVYTAILILCLGSAQAQNVGEKAKLSNVELFDGSKFDAKSEEGKPTVIYFWASWCPICHSEMPNIEKHYQTFKDRGFNVRRSIFETNGRKRWPCSNASSPSRIRWAS